MVAVSTGFGVLPTVSSEGCKIVGSGGKCQGKHGPVGKTRKGVAQMKKKLQDISAAQTSSHFSCISHMQNVV